MLRKTLLLLFAVAAAGTGHAQTVLRFNSWLPATHPVMASTVKPWAEQVEKATAGRVRFEFTASSLGPPPNQFDMVKDGIADAALTVHGYTPARFPLMRMGELPFLSDLSEPLSSGLWTVNQKYFLAKNEHAGTHLAALFVSQPGRVWTTRRALKSLKDWEGLKLAGGAAINVEEAKALGGVGIRAPGPAGAEMLKRGTVDGVFIDVSSFTDFSLAGTVKHMLDLPRGIHAATFCIIINQAKWEAIAPADRAAIDRISGEALSRTAGRNWDRSAATAREAVKAAGVEVTLAQGEYFKALQERLAHFEEEWVRQASALGVDARAALADLRAAIAKP